jgi:hypothetical protein
MVKVTIAPSTYDRDCSLRRRQQTAPRHQDREQKDAKEPAELASRGGDPVAGRARSHREDFSRSSRERHGRRRGRAITES